MLPTMDTQNAFDPLDFGLNPVGWFGGTGDKPEITVDTLTNFEGFKYVKHVRIIGHGSNWSNTLKPSIRNTANPNESYTVSAFCKMNEWKDTSGILSLNVVEIRNYNSDFSGYDQRDGSIYTTNKGNDWFRYKATIENTSSITSYIQANFLYPTGISEGDIIDLYFAYPQFEKKPFATSFVDGSRPLGKMILDVPDLQYDNFVFSCWANKRYLSSQLWQMLITIFTPDNDLATEANHYSVRLGSGIDQIYININSYERGTSTTSKILIEDGWHFFVIAVHDNMTDFWIDNEKYSIGNYVSNSKDKKIYLGDWKGFSYEWQNPISNIFIGKYKDDNGNVIWTDEYINYVYKNKIRFNSGSNF
jgi:hypothetical protein